MARIQKDSRSIYRAFRKAAVSLVAATITTVTLPVDVWARSHTPHPESTQVPAIEHGHAYTDTVVNEETGEILRRTRGDDQRFPASITKLMTAYLAFVAMDNGRVQPDDLVTISKAAADKARSDGSPIGFRAGQKIRFGDLLIAMAVKSDNTAATAIAEYIGGTEENFARQMTAMAAYLGMGNTRYTNATGLPQIQVESCTSLKTVDDVAAKQEKAEQAAATYNEKMQARGRKFHPRNAPKPTTSTDHVTTALDMAILGMAFLKHFPEQAAAFSTASFTYTTTTLIGKGKKAHFVRNTDTFVTHLSALRDNKNDLIEGGKTGWTCDSGATIVGWTKEGQNARLIGVILGAPSPATRDVQFKNILKAERDAATAIASGTLPERGRISSRIVLPPKPAGLPDENGKVFATLPTPSKPVVTESVPALPAPPAASPAAVPVS